MYNWIDSNTRDRDWTGFRRSVVVSFFFREIWGNSRNPIKANWSKQIQVLSCIISWPVFLSFSCQAGRATDWLNKKGQLRPKIRQCTVGCCLLNFRCCCSILFVKISFFSFLRQVPRIKHIFFFSISYNTSNQHFNSRPRHLISGSSMLHNGTDGCFIFFSISSSSFSFGSSWSTCFKVRHHFYIGFFIHFFFKFLIKFQLFFMFQPFILFSKNT